MRLDSATVKEYNVAVTDNIPSRVTLPTGKSVTDTHQRRASRPPALFRFWRWLTCGHGHHAWHLHVAIELAGLFTENGVIVARRCPRCDTTEILE